MRFAGHFPHAVSPQYVFSGTFYRKFTYKDEKGNKPLGEFIKSLRPSLRAKVVGDLHLLEEFGNYAREPLSKHLDDGIFELRTEESGDTVRVLYFFDEGRIILCTNGCVKKQRPTPKSEIELAKKRRALYYARKEAQND